MNAFRVVCCTAYIATAQQTTATATQTNPLSRAVSVSRQFNAYASNSLLPPAICVFAERIKREWLIRFDLRDNWRDPIVLVVVDRAVGTNAPALSLEIFLTDLHLKYQIRAVIPPPLDESQFTGSIVEALCLEAANRNRPARRTGAFRAVSVPPWIVRGFTASITGRPDVLLAVARRSLAAGLPVSAAGVLEAQTLPEEPAEMLLFDANAWLMLESVLALPDGSAKLHQLLVGAGGTNTFATIFADDFKNKMMREKWWSLQLSRRTAANVAEQLNPQETSRVLDKILVTKLEQEDGAGRELALAELWMHFEKPWLPEVLHDKLDRLEALRSRTHAIQRPVLDAYAEAIRQLQQQHLNRFRRSLCRADQLNAKTQQELQQIRAFVDHAERAYATQNPVADFHGYFRALEQIESAQQSRHNPISDYLDKFDH